MSKKNDDRHPAQALLDASEALEAAADRFGTEDNTDETKAELRQTALAFADAWRSCDGKGRP